MTSIDSNSINKEPIYYGGELPEVLVIGDKLNNTKIFDFKDENNNGIVDTDDFKDNQQFVDFLKNNGYLGTSWSTFKDKVKTLYSIFIDTVDSIRGSIANKSKSVLSNIVYYLIKYETLQESLSKTCDDDVQTMVDNSIADMCSSLIDEQKNQYEE